MWFVTNMNSIPQILKPVCFAFVALVALPNATIAAPKNKPVKPQKISANKFLGNGVWRVDNCEEKDFFQAFNLSDKSPSVEVGAGVIGEGETLKVLSTSVVNGMIEVRTTVCAPIGCNKTWEQYKILGNDKMQEWNFEGHLPNQEPNVVVKEGVAFDGSQGRIFKKCKA